MVTGYNERLRLRATSESNQTNCPLKLTIAKGSGDNTASTIYLNDKALNWPNDIRFTNEAGTELSFWREESDATDGTWHIKIDSLTANETAYIYLWYGNAAAADASSAANTFAFYDDFDTGNLSKWTTAQAAWSAQGTVKEEGSYAAKATGQATNTLLSKTIALSSSIKIHAHVRFSDNVYGHYFYPVRVSTASGKDLYALYMGGGKFFSRSAMLPTSASYTVDTWYDVDVVIDNENQLFRWWINGISQGTASLKDQFNNFVDTTDYATSVSAHACTTTGSDGYIDQYYVCSWESTAKWLHPTENPALDDGLYVVERRIDYSFKPEETLRASAYNDYALEFIMSKAMKVDPGAYSYWHGEWLLQDDVKHGIAAHYTSGELKCGFNHSETDTGKTIVDVTVAAFVSGRARTIFTYDGVDYYGTLSTKKHVAAWLETEYTTIPGTSDPWTFSDLGATPTAGVDIRKTSATVFPIIYNTEGTPLDPPESLGEWETDPSMYFLDTTCYCVKILVHYCLNSAPTEILTLELLPRSMSSYEPRLSVVHQNVINNGDEFGSPIFMYVGEVTSFFGDVFKKFYPEDLGYVDGGSVEFDVVVSDWVVVGGGSYLWQWRPYIKINGTKYYKSYTTGPGSASWATNPATSAAWADGDLIDGDGCGVEAINIYSGENWIYPRINDPTLTIIASDTTEYESTYGDLECTPTIWYVSSQVVSNHYEYYINDMQKCNLIGDMYRYDAGWGNMLADELSKRFESDLSEIPPSHSQINGFSVTASVFAWSYDTANTYWRIFINVDGTRYYSSEYTTVGHPNLAKTETCAWDTNPATSAAWAYDEIQGVKYGIEVTRSDEYDQVIFRPYALYVDIDFQAIVGPKNVVYHQIPIIDSSVSLTKNSNTPKFKADELRCVLPVGFYLPERTEIVLAEDGSHVFHGFVWQADERPNKETKILGKSQSHVLACRYIPNFFYHARNSRWMTVYSLDEVFSDAVPIYPNEFGWMAYSSHDDEYGRWINIEGYWDNPVLSYPVKPLIYQLVGTYSNIGIFFLLNSMIPYGYAGDTDRYGDVAGLSYNRAKFLMSHNPSNIPKVENLGYCLLDSDRRYWGWNGCDPTVEYTVSDTDPTYMSDQVGGVKRFRQGDPDTLFYDEYAYSDQDMLVSHCPGAFMVLFDHALDTFIRPGRFELDDKFLAVPYLFDGSYSDAFSDFFFRLGQEVRFRNSSNGYVYMDVASELGNAASLKFIDGSNATVTKSVRDPRPAAVLGNDFQPGLSTDWMPARTWLTQIEPTQRSGEDLQEWLDLRRDEDKSTWTVKTKDKFWHVQPGDHVFAQAHGQGLEEVRVRKAVISNAGTTLTCGKRISDLSDEWGQWRSVKGSTDADTDMPVQVQEIDLGDCDGSQTFVIKAEEYEIGSWKCKLTVDWSLDVDEGYTADIASAPLGMFLVVQVNSKVVPPGRILSKGNSGSVEIDITEFCTCSTSADQTNTVALKLWRGVTSTHYRHKISGNITQYRRLEAVDNA